MRTQQGFVNPASEAQAGKPAADTLRAGMVVAPGAGRIEVAGPDAEAGIAGGGFLGPVAARGNGEAFGNHGGTEIATINAAGGEEPVILVDILGAAIGWTGGQQFRHAIVRGAATGPDFTVISSAILREFGGIEAEQANAVFAQAEAVAIAGTGKAGNRRRWAIQGGGNHGQNGQHRYGQDGPARPPKDGIAPASSLQDFTTR
jgi:hypothetical protein